MRDGDDGSERARPRARMGGGLVLVAVLLGCPADAPEFPPSADSGGSAGTSTGGVISSSDGSTAMPTSTTDPVGSESSSSAITGDGSESDGEKGTCGDGRVDSGEQCDDGRRNASDGACLPGCVLATCGDGFIQAGVEECEPSNLGGQTCRTLGFDGGTLGCSACVFDVSSCCTQLGGGCDRDGVCCMGLQCVDGECCAAAGQPCDDNGMCCSGLCFAGPGLCA